MNKTKLHTTLMEIVENEHAIAMYKSLLFEEEYTQSDEAFEFHLSQYIDYKQLHPKLEAKYRRTERAYKVMKCIKGIFKK